MFSCDLPYIYQSQTNGISSSKKADPKEPLPNAVCWHRICTCERDMHCDGFTLLWQDSRNPTQQFCILSGIFCFAAFFLYLFFLFFFDKQLYNLDTKNLAEHGIHPRVTHLLVNFPLLLGPVVLLAFGSFVKVTSPPGWFTTTITPPPRLRSLLSSRLLIVFTNAFRCAM